MLITSIDDNGAYTLYQSWWRNPDVIGIEKGSEDYYKLIAMWEEATGITIPEEEKDGTSDNQRPD